MKVYYFLKKSKVLTKQEEPNVCWDDDKMIVFFLNLHLVCFSRRIQRADKTPGQ